MYFRRKLSFESNLEGEQLPQAVLPEIGRRSRVWECFPAGGMGGLRRRIVSDRVSGPIYAVAFIFRLLFTGRGPPTVGVRAFGELQVGRRTTALSEQGQMRAPSFA
jgi:hypothetical protein